MVLSFATFVLRKLIHFVQWIVAGYDEERTRRTKKQKGDAHLYTIIKVARDEDLAEWIGRDIYDDLIDHDKYKKYDSSNYQRNLRRLSSFLGSTMRRRTSREKY
ncbi:hypothetical protein K1719_000991 [Acacia pycnantha]|nr:hypothetical protein K1719_000991 [Acacia pycnantha]